jgi:hypothetical protein
VAPLVAMGHFFFFLVRLSHLQNNAFTAQHGSGGCRKPSTFFG